MRLRSATKASVRSPVPASKTQQLTARQQVGRDRFTLRRRFVSGTALIVPTTVPDLPGFQCASSAQQLEHLAVPCVGTCEFADAVLASASGLASIEKMPHQEAREGLKGSVSRPPWGWLTAGLPSNFSRGPRSSSAIPPAHFRFERGTTAGACVIFPPRAAAGLLAFEPPATFTHLSPRADPRDAVVSSKG